MKFLLFKVHLIISLLIVLNLGFDKATAAVIEWSCTYKLYASIDGLQPTDFRMRFTLDTVTNKAFIKGNLGVEPVHPIINPSELIFTFIEITDIKNVMTTTIVKNGDSVHSRNSTLPSKIIASQYYGNCLTF
jgi:hypothetical protein